MVGNGIGDGLTGHGCRVDVERCGLAPLAPPPSTGVPHCGPRAPPFSASPGDAIGDDSNTVDGATGAGVFAGLKPNATFARSITAYAADSADPARDENDEAAAAGVDDSGGGGG